MAKQKKRASWNELTHKLSTEFRAHEKLFFATLGRTLGESSASAGSIGGVRNAAGEVCLDEPGKREAMAGFYGKLGQPVIESTPVGEDGQGMNAILQSACPIDAKPVRHPDIPCRAIGIGYLTLHSEGASCRCVVDAR